jgi:hypothetical protein
MKKLLENFRKYLNEDDDYDDYDKYDLQDGEPVKIRPTFIPKFSNPEEDDERSDHDPDVVDTSEETMDGWIFEDGGLLDIVRERFDTWKDEPPPNTPLGEEERELANNVIAVLKSAESLSPGFQDKLSGLMGDFRSARETDFQFEAPELNEVGDLLRGLMPKSYGGER